MHYVDPDFDTFEEFMAWFLAGKIVHVFEYHTGLITPGPDVCEVEGPRPPKIPKWQALVQYDENNVIKGVTQ
jgi:hypothetical protein